MERNKVTLKNDVFDHVIQILEKAKKMNAIDVSLFEYISSMEDKVSAVIMTEGFRGEKEYEHISIARYDEEWETSNTERKINNYKLDI